MAETTRGDKIRQKRKQQVILSGAQLFLSEGIDKVKMTDVADSAEIGVATLYRYFGTKTSILTAVGALLWQDIAILFEEQYNNDTFQQKTGVEQISVLLHTFVSIYTTQKPFLRFLSQFDHYVLANEVSSEELRDYEANVLNFYPIFLRSYQRGCEDGSLNAVIDIQEFYNTITHALLSASQKFIGGEVLSSDNFASAEKELTLLIQMAIQYISKH